MSDDAALREAFRTGRVLWTLHAGLEAAAEALREADVEAAVAEAGEVIESIRTTSAARRASSWRAWPTACRCMW